MKKRSKGELGSLDSLLDTMTTVVGILIILLIVVQFDVEKTVNRIISGEIADLPKVSPEQVTSLRSELDHSVAASAEKAVKIPEMKGLLASSEFELQRLDTRVKATTSQLKNTTDTEKALEELSVLIAQQQTTVKELEEDIEAKQEMLQSMYARMEKVPAKVKGPPPKVVRLPDPRDPPTTAQPLHIVCRGGRLYPIFPAKLKEQVEIAIKNSRSRKNEKGELDAKTVISFFRRVPVGDRWWRLEAIEENHRLKFIYHRRTTTGEIQRGLSHPISNYMKILGGLDPKKNYLRYYVWPDSFGVYLEARGLATDKNLLAGWVPTERKDDWASYFGEYWTEGAAKNRPKPVKPKPGAPPPKAPPKVRDVID